MRDFKPRIIALICFSVWLVAGSQALAWASSPTTPASSSKAAPTAAGSAASPAAKAATPSASSASASSSALAKGVAEFKEKCTGCHTVGHGVEVGPDLIAVKGWPRKKLLKAMKPMEAMVGTLTDAEKNALADLLLSPDAKERIAGGQQAKAAKTGGSASAAPAASPAAKAATTTVATAASSSASSASSSAFAKGVAEFKEKCSGCHTVGHGVEVGPDLIAVKGWPKKKLLKAMKPMEAMVGTLTDAEKNALADLLSSPDAKERIAGGQQAKAAKAPAAAAPGATAGSDDVAAGDFMTKCAACHTVGQGALVGPDLKPSTNWPKPQLVTAIKRMEKNVGPMSNGEINQLVDLLQSPQVHDRLIAEQKRIAMRQVTRTTPASAARGKQLFEGIEPFANGGTACIACHKVQGHGGTLAKDLTGIYGLLGQTALQSACENTTFPVMRAVYREHPVSEQEALDLTKYFESLQHTPPGPADPAVAGIGMVGALLLLALVGIAYRGRLRGIRARLLAKSIGRSGS